MKKKIAAAVLAGGLSTMAFAGVANATSPQPVEPLPGHFAGCSGQYDGSMCWSQDGGVIQHLNMG